MLGDLQQATALADEALELWRALGQSRGVAVALTRRGMIASLSGDHHHATALLTEARDRFREIEGLSQPRVMADLALAETVQMQGGLPAGPVAARRDIVRGEGTR